MSNIDEGDYILLVRLSSGGFVEVSVLDIELIWHIKVKLYKILGIPPERQMLFLLGEAKELENLARVFDFPELKVMKGEKRLVILKEKKEESLSRRVRKKPPMLKGKKFREALSPQYSYAGGRGLQKGVVNYVNSFFIHTIGKEFQPIGSKDSRKFFEVIISKKENNEQVHTNIQQYQVNYNDNIIEVRWASQLPGNFAITIRTTDGYAICGSPFTTTIVDHENSGAKVKQLANSEFNVEAARVLSEWSTKEEYNNIILKEIGIETILSLTTTEPVALLQPIMGDILSRLLEKDAFRISIIASGIKHLLDIVELNKSIRNTTISQFLSKSFSLVGHYVYSIIAPLEASKSQIPRTGVLNHIDTTFFEVIGEMLRTNDDVETIRNLSRAIASFSGCQFYSLMISNLLPFITPLFENTETDISTRRYALLTISNLTSFMGISKIKFNIITESTVQKLISCVDYPLTGDQLVTESLKALANLCDFPQFVQIISSHPCIERIVKSISGTDTLANWEIFASAELLDETFNVDIYTQTFMRTFSHDDDFNYESVRLLCKLLMNSKDIYKIIVKYNAIRSLVLFINSGNLALQEVACNIISLLAKFIDCRKEIIRFGGLQSLCMALNTCTSTAIAPIIGSLAQMPLNVKGILVNIIGDIGVRKLVEYYKHSDSNELRKHAAILLASLVGNDGSYDIIKQGGSELVKSLIDLIKNRTVNVVTFIPPTELVFKDVIGEGISGVVWEAMWKDEVVAVKRFNEESISFSEEEFQSEVALMSVLRHENISHCLGSWMSEDNYYIVCELFERGSLDKIIEDTTQELSLPMIVHIALGAAKGMSYLHRLGIIHRDLKSGNLLVNYDWCVKVADFGLSRVSDKLMTRGVGTPIYTAPEVLAGNSYTLKADVYSFAYVLWELVTRKVPFEDLPPFEAVHRAATEYLRPEIPENCILEHIITHCWDSDPSRRPDFEEVIRALLEIQSYVGQVSLLELHPQSSEEEEEDKLVKKNNSKIQVIKNLHVKEEKRKKDHSRLLRSYSSSPKLKSYYNTDEAQDLVRSTSRKNFGPHFNFN